MYGMIVHILSSVLYWYTGGMILFFTPLHVFVATLVGFVFGFIWYSPFLFMKAWLRGEGVTQDHVPKRSRHYMVRINVYSFIAHAAMASVLAIMFDLLTVTSLKVALSLGLLLCFAFIVTTRFIDMIYTVSGNHYEIKSQVRFLVSSGYYLAVIAIMSWVLFLMRVAV